MILIEADMLKESLEQLKNDAYMEDEVIEAAVYDLCIDRVEASPAIEAEPVKHGEWDEISSVKHIGKCIVPISKCSCCGFLFCDIFNRSDLYNYCPNCGAKMDATD